MSEVICSPVGCAGAVAVRGGQAVGDGTRQPVAHPSPLEARHRTPPGGESTLQRFT